jgi:catechol 1,2-dioxygenase
MFRTPDPRTKEILSCFVKHLHAFVRETKLTEKEFQDAIGYVNAIGQRTTPSHNEAMLLSGALGVSNLVCLMNNGAKGTRPTQANNLGPFYRAGAPHLENGASLLRSPTPGPELFFRGFVKTAENEPVAGAEIDVWHSSTVGLYENQDKTQAEMNLRGRFTTLAGRLVQLPQREARRLSGADRGPDRRAAARAEAAQHAPGAPALPDPQARLQDHRLAGLRPGRPAPRDRLAVRRDARVDRQLQKEGSGFSLEFTFVVEPGESWRPKAPITGKVAA